MTKTAKNLLQAIAILVIVLVTAIVTYTQTGKPPSVPVDEIITAVEAVGDAVDEINQGDDDSAKE